MTMSHYIPGGFDFTVFFGITTVVYGNATVIKYGNSTISFVSYDISRDFLATMKDQVRDPTNVKILFHRPTRSLYI